MQATSLRRTCQPPRRTVAAWIWKREAERLLREFWTTGELNHLAAFIIHILAMRRRLIGGRGRS